VNKPVYMDLVFTEIATFSKFYLQH